MTTPSGRLLFRNLRQRVLYDHCDDRVKCCMTNFFQGSARQLLVVPLILALYSLAARSVAYGGRTARSSELVKPIASNEAFAGAVLHVTTLESSGIGSLRRALDDPHPRP